MALDKDDRMDSVKDYRAGIFTDAVCGKRPYEEPAKDSRLRDLRMWFWVESALRIILDDYMADFSVPTSAEILRVGDCTSFLDERGELGELLINRDLDDNLGLCSRSRSPKVWYGIRIGGDGGMGQGGFRSGLDSLDKKAFLDFDDPDHALFAFLAIGLYRGGERTRIWSCEEITFNKAGPLRCNDNSVAKTFVCHTHYPNTGKAYVRDLTTECLDSQLCDYPECTEKHSYCSRLGASCINCRFFHRYNMGDFFMMILDESAPSQPIGTNYKRYDFEFMFGKRVPKNISHFSFDFVKYEEMLDSKYDVKSTVLAYGDTNWSILSVYNDKRALFEGILAPANISALHRYDGRLDHPIGVTVRNLQKSPKTSFIFDPYLFIGLPIQRQDTMGGDVLSFRNMKHIFSKLYAGVGQGEYRAFAGMV